MYNFNFPPGLRTGLVTCFPSQPVSKRLADSCFCSTAQSTYGIMISKISVINNITLVEQALVKYLLHNGHSSITTPIFMGTYDDRNVNSIQYCQNALSTIDSQSTNFYSKSSAFVIVDAAFISLRTKRTITVNSHSRTCRTTVIHVSILCHASRYDID